MAERSLFRAAATNYFSNRIMQGASTLTQQTAKAILITTSRDDWFEFMRWKEIYEKLEDATDLCEDIADVLQTIVLKHS